MARKGAALAALALAVFLLAAPAGRAQGTRKDDIVLNSRGLPLAGATVRVCTAAGAGQPCAPLAQIYSDAALTQALANPTTTDGMGNYTFYAAPGKYMIEISGPSITTRQMSNVLLPSDPTAPSFSGAISAFSLSLGGNLSVGGSATVGGAANLNGGGTLAGTFSGNPTFSGSPTFNANFTFKGPNPYVDATAYGVRAVAQNAAPAIPGVTAGINSASTTATLSVASTFQNGDGVVIFGAGAVHAMTTPGAPTVTPSVASAGTGTGLVVNGPAGGATNYNYQIVARNKSQGLTAASTVGTTAAGSAGLGVQTVTITSLSKSGTTNTVVTSAAHGLSVGSMVNVQGTTDPADFDGWFVVATVADTTHFTYVNGMDSNAGAGTSATGGTARWWNCNHLTWTAVAGAWEYYIYGRTGGSLTLLGVSKPNGGTYIDLTWDDFGSPMMDNYSAPYFVPNTPPGAATSNSLVTTIASGAGTTSLTLAAAASTTVAGATILFDNAPNILSTATPTVQGNGTLYFPVSTTANTFYVVNSYLTLPAYLAISQAGNFYLNDTIELSGATRWFGNLTPQAGSPPAFSFEGYPGIWSAKANPGMYSPGFSASAIRGVGFFSGATNNSIHAILDYAFGATLDSVNFSGSGSASEYMAMFLNFRGDVANTSYSNQLRTVAFIPSTVATGSSMTPSFYCNGCGLLTIDRVNLTSRGIFYRTINQGTLSVQTSRLQGGIIPFLTLYSGVNGATLNATIKDIELDTMPHATVANLSSLSLNSAVTLINSGYPASSGSGFPANTTGKPISRLVATSAGTVQNVQTAALDTSSFSDNSLQVGGTNGAMGYQLLSSVAPTVAVSAGGSVPVGNWTYKISWVDAAGRESLVGLASSTATTSSGNQTITVTPPAAPAGAVGWRPYRSNGGAWVLINMPGGCTASIAPGVNFVDTFSFGCNNSVPTSGLALTAGASSNGLFGQQLGLTGGGFKNTVSGTFTANRTQTLQDATDTFVYRNTADTLANKTLTSSALTTPTIGGGTALTVYRRIAVSLSPAAVAANTCAAQSFTVTGLAAGDILIAVNKPTEQAGLSVLPGHVSAANTATLNFCNHTAASITPTASESYSFVAVQ
ncbi:MAG: hypothetical protein LAN71_13715 [Acidobacteriia bacterium]|nr:hypothetical protein [Terriglobia bacterium]